MPTGNFKNLTWIFFDLGNTLIDETAAQNDRITRLSANLADNGYLVSTAHLHDAMRQAAKEFSPRLIVRALELVGSDDLHLGQILQSVKYDKTFEYPYPEAATALTKLAASYKLAVIANQSQGTEDRLRAYGLRNIISLLLTSNEEGIEKPDTAIFQRAIARAHCAPDQAVMVGDRLDNDIAPANASGWATVRVVQGYAQHQQPRNDREIPDQTVDSLSGLLPIFFQV